MTKITKKSSKKTFILISLAIALISILSFGATFAWFTATTKKNNSTEFTTGHVKITSGNVTFTESADNVFPGETLWAAANSYFDVDTSDEKGNYVAFTITVTGKDGTTAKADIANIAELLKLDESLNTTDWKKSDTYGGMYYLGTSETSLTPKTTGKTPNILSKDLVFNVDDNWEEGNDNSDKKLMKATITITIQAASIQVTNLPQESAASTALEALAKQLGLTA